VLLLYSSFYRLGTDIHVKIPDTMQNVVRTILDVFSSNPISIKNGDRRKKHGINRRIPIKKQKGTTAPSVNAKGLDKMKDPAKRNPRAI
jgi:hypothetical protein